MQCNYAGADDRVYGETHMEPTAKFCVICLPVSDPHFVILFDLNNFW